MKLLNMILDSEKMPEKWRKSVLLLISKNDVQSYSGYKGIKLMSPTMRI